MTKREKAVFYYPVGDNMEKIYLDKKEFNNLNFIDIKFKNRDGVLIRQGNYLYKLYDKKQAKRKEELIDTLGNIKGIDNCVIPDAKIYYKNRFRLIRMEYYSQYQTLFELFKSDIDLQKRLLLCKKSIETIKDLYNHGIGYHDIHTENIIVNDEDIKLVDLDGSILLSKCNIEQLEFAKHRIAINTIMLILTCFYQTEFHEMVPKNENVLRFILTYPMDNRLRTYVIRFISQYLNGETMDTNFEQLLNFFEEEKIKRLI